MSKISDYIRAVKDHFNRIEEDRQRQTVAEFANELRKPVDSLLEQFRSAGIHKQANDVVTDAEKRALNELDNRVTTLETQLAAARAQLANLPMGMVQLTENAYTALATKDPQMYYTTY